MDRSTSRYVAFAALAAGAVALGALAVCTALPSILGSSTAAIQHFASYDPAETYRKALIRYAAKPGRLPESYYRQALESARRTPLSADPMVLIATKAIADREGDRAIRLLEEARHRNPRQRLARALLLERYIRTNRLQEAGIEAATLGRLTPEASAVLINALVLMAMDPLATDAVTRALRGDRLLNPLLEQLIARGASTDLVLRVARGWRSQAGGEDGQWRTNLLERLIFNGEYSRARALWVRFGDNTSGALKPINAALDPSPNLPPFSWKLVTEDIGVAEITQHRVLMIDYFGRLSGPLVSQLALFQPGDYVVSATVEGTSNGQGGKLAWVIRCAVPGKPANAGPVLLSAPITGSTGGPRRQRNRFVVPVDCPAQWVVVEGISAEFPTTQSIEMRNLSFVSLSSQ